MRTTKIAFGKKKFFIDPKFISKTEHRTRVPLEDVFKKDDNDIFNLNIKSFRPLFNRGFNVKSITTDGVSCSVLFTNGEILNKYDKNQKKRN